MEGTPSITERPSRLRTLTEKGYEFYERALNHHYARILPLSQDIDKLLQTCHSPSVDEPELLQKKLLKTFREFEAATNDLIRYLQTQRTLASENELVSQTLIIRTKNDKVTSALNELDKLLEIKLGIKQERSSVTTSGSRHSKVRSHQSEKRDRNSDRRSHRSENRDRDSYKHSHLSVKREPDSDRHSQQSENRDHKSDRRSHQSEKHERHSERRSRHSQSSSVYMKQKLEAAKIKQKYIEKECELIREKMEIELKMKKLESSKELETAENQLDVLYDSDNSDHSSVSASVVAKRTEDYVEEQRDLYCDDLHIQSENDAFDTNADSVHLPQQSLSQTVSSTQYSPFQQTVSSSPYTHVPITYSVNRTRTGPVTTYQPPTQSYNPVVTQSFVTVSQPSLVHTMPQPSVSPTVTGTPRTTHVSDGNYGSQHATSDSNATSANTDLKLCEELSRFLMKKDFLKYRQYKFDDNPAYFETWKSTFQGIVAELGLTAKEQMELLQSSLGPESSGWARSIYTSNSNPVIACEEIWKRLHDTYGRPEELYSKLKERVVNFPRLSDQDSRKLYQLADLASEINAVKQNARHAAQFARYDSSDGVSEFVLKLPYSVRNKWISQATKYKNQNNSVHPPFSVFVKFLFEMAKMKNDPSFRYDVSKKSAATTGRGNNTSTQSGQVMKVRKTLTSDEQGTSAPDIRHAIVCPLHETSHSLNSCRAFRTKPLEERMDFLYSKGLCVKCCGQRPHNPRNCRRKVVCGICKANGHPTALHQEKTGSDHKPVNPQSHTTESDNTHLKTMCTTVCGDPRWTSKSCSKTVLVQIYPADRPQRRLSTYAIIDEQSDYTLAKPALFDYFGVDTPETVYSLWSCSGVFQQSGREVSGLVVESVDGSYKVQLPPVTECEHLPNTRNEIPTPDVARSYVHMQDIADKIPPLDDQAQVLLLIGRDLLPAHHVLEQRLGPERSPYAQRLRLGWVVIGEVCHKTFHQTDPICVRKTFIHTDGRPSHLEPCLNHFLLRKEHSDVFVKTDIDDMPGSSIQDKQFLAIMNQGIEKDDEGCWSVPLPFKEERPRLPSNRALALKRALMLTSSLRNNPQKRDHVVSFMSNILDRGHAELAPPLKERQEHCYLPLFAVYHPKKPDKVRCVFDSSAKCQGVSLNDVLLTGPDMLNNLLGVLMRFRQRPVAISADIEQMFYRFSVPSSDRDFLRFFWHQENDIEKPLVEYRMKRHVFGNSPSPAIATFCLRQTAQNADEDVRRFVEGNFYVDDGLTSLDSPEEAVSLLTRTKDHLQSEGSIRLHKIASNDARVLRAFSADDLATDIASVNLELSETPPQRSLGVRWDIAHDVFTFHVSDVVHPFTKRGVLATVNSLYDPFGFLAPVTVKGKLIMRDIMSLGLDWDDPLPVDCYSRWQEWCETLPLLESVTVPRAYVDIPSSSVARRELHIFSDASQDAIAAVAFMKLYDVNGNKHVGFVHGKAKVAPRHGHTIPRLELCAALMATQLKDTIVRHLDDDYEITMYTDSKVVLGYINNEQRRFYVYVSNRVSSIRQSTLPSQWTYISSEENPADVGTRSCKSSDIDQSIWLRGPSFLTEHSEPPIPFEEPFPLVTPDSDHEVRPLVVMKTRSSPTAALAERFGRFSSWSRLTSVVARLRHIAQSFSSKRDSDSTCHGWHICSLKVKDFEEAEKFIIREVQRATFREEIGALTGGSDIPKSSPIASLSPYLDEEGLLRVGGRLMKAKDELKDIVVNPVIIPKNSHVALLLTRHYHSLVHHQGQRLTEGRLRSAGYWIIGAKGMVSSVIHHCVFCRKLRGKFCAPKMADLPPDRLTPGPPFTFVGLDTFGPWNVVARKTRGGHAASKRWAIIFTCLTSRAIHLEVVDELSTPSFINALRRFLAIRGPVRLFRSDRGTNFVGAVHDLGIPSKFIEEKPIKEFLNSNGCSWEFNPPHASHFGGVWERMIGVTRRILDAMLLRQGTKELTHDILSTLLAEVCAIVNSRPLTPLSNDPSDSLVLTPAMLLTQKIGILPETIPPLSTREMYKSHWHHVQVLANEFWRKWQREYLCQLQARQKWTSDQPNLAEGDVVLLREYDSHRNHWPMARVIRAFEATDGRVREVEVRVFSDGKFVCYTRPVHELIKLLD